MSDIPRRIRIDMSTPTELAIRAAVDAVEALPADVRLTNAVVLLHQARELVADFVDGVPRADTEGDRQAPNRTEVIRQRLLEAADQADGAQRYWTVSDVLNAREAAGIISDGQDDGIYWHRRYQDESKIVASIWAALNISTYEQAGGKDIGTLVSDLLREVIRSRADTEGDRPHAMNEFRDAVKALHDYGGVFSRSYTSKFCGDDEVITSRKLVDLVARVMSLSGEWLRADTEGDASPARPDFVRMFLSKLPDMACAEVRLEEDGDVGFDWDHSKHRTLTASVSTTGRVSWAALIHDWKAYGHFDMPDWPSDFAEALERIDVAEALPDPPVQP
jgi:hypothetical protein